MPEVELALTFDNDNEYSLRGHTRYWVPNEQDYHGSNYYVSARIYLDEATSRAIDLTKRVWIKDNPLPLTFLDNTGHGENRGLVIRGGYCLIDSFDNTEAEIISSELVIRISVGGKNHGGRHHDLENASRHHFSVRANRQFFPADWKNIGLEETTSLVEEVNYSLRWINGKFDDWSDPNEWAEGSSELDQKTFDNRRTTYAVSYPQEIKNRRGCPNNPSPEQIIEQIYKIGRKRRLIPLTFQDNCVGKHFRDTISPGEHTGSPEDRNPILGYACLASALRPLDFPQTFPESIASPSQGVELTFSKALPALERFTQYA